MNIGGYDIDKQVRIGTSSKGSVFNCKKQGQEMIVKILQLENQGKIDKQVERELEITKIIQKNRHQNLISIHDVIVQEKTAYIFMEKCQLTLKEYIDYKKGNFTEKEYLDFLYQISSGYNYLIELHIFHRDIKSENIVVTLDLQGSPIYKFIDFGAGIIHNTKTFRFQTPAQGTQATSAPEVQTNNYDNRADLYSLAIIVLQMCDFLILRQSFSNGKKIIDFISNSTTLKKVFVKPDNLPEFVWDILDKIIIKKENRLFWQEFSDIIKSQKQSSIITCNFSPSSQFNSPVKVSNPYNQMQQFQQQPNSQQLYFTPNKINNQPNNFNNQLGKMSAPHFKQQSINYSSPQGDQNKQIAPICEGSDSFQKFKTEQTQQPVNQGPIKQVMNSAFPDKKNLNQAPSCLLFNKNIQKNDQFEEKNFNDFRRPSLYISPTYQNNNPIQMQPFSNQHQKQSSFQDQSIIYQNNIKIQMQTKNSINKK